MEIDLAGDFDFRAPDMGAPLNADLHRELMTGNRTVKGMFFEPLLRAMPERGGRNQRYVAFRSYPMSDYMELLIDAAKALHPDHPLREALRRVGHLGYPTFAESLIGRVIMGVLGDDLNAIMARAPRAYSVSIEPGEVRSLQLHNNHWRMAFIDMPNFVDCYQLGVVEGAIMHCGAEPSVRTCSLALDTAVFDVRWH
ncbi:MAG: DUF2378 family protein [Polyangiaceae bacterium]